MELGFKHAPDDYTPVAKEMLRRLHAVQADCDKRVVQLFMHKVLIEDHTRIIKSVPNPVRYVADWIHQVSYGIFLAASRIDGVHISDEEWEDAFKDRGSPLAFMSAEIERVQILNNATANVLGTNKLTMKDEYVFSILGELPVSTERSDASNIYCQHRRALIRGDEEAWKIEEDVMAKRTTLAEHYTVKK